jgi:hypothetical protein
MSKRFALAIAVTAAAVLALAGAKASAQAPGFSTVIDNQYFPLAPGTVLQYEGTRDGRKAASTTVVTNKTRVIQGVTCVVVSDTGFTNNKATEKTSDYYAQDNQGNVWYFGEDSFDLVKGKWVRSDGSWLTGVDGAQPGIIMEAHPRVGDTYRQEYYPGHAEDMAQVLSTNASVSVPYGSFDHALQTKEWTPLEPGVVDNKYYAAGIGEVEAVNVQGGDELMQLDSVTRGG